jgi:predicted nucleic acid-binding protein
MLTPVFGLIIMRIVEEGDIVLYSNVVEFELSCFYTKDIVKDIFSLVQSQSLKKVTIQEKRTKEAILLSKKRGIPYGDAMHAVLARDNDAILVTRDKDFTKLQDVSSHQLPEDLI